MDERVEAISKNLSEIQEHIHKAAQKARRDEKLVQLVAVSKMQPVEVIDDAVQAGVVVFGENYPEETVGKISVMRPLQKVEWHMIGHLQSRKAKLVVDYFNALESLDGVDMAIKLDRLLEVKSKKLPVLLEFNVSGEASKSGWPAWDEDRWQDLLPDVEAVLQLPNLQVRGLMTMPPILAQTEQVRPYFARLRRLSEYLSMKFHECDFSILSMGTSADFEIAVQEGARLVRIGTAIFGPRPQKRV
jgi:PLP dependent protein